MLGILVPTQFEASELLKRVENRRVFAVKKGKAWSGSLCGHEVIILLCGMGPIHSAARAYSLIERVAPDELILAGFAGGLDPVLKLGDVVSCKHLPDPKIIYSSRVVVPTAEAKHELRKSTGCRVVEMEAAFVAEEAKRFDLPLSVIRTVSDDCDEALPDCLQYGYDMEAGKESPLRMAWHLIRHPGQIAQLRLFLKRTSPLAAIIANAVVAHIEQMATEKQQE